MEINMDKNEKLVINFEGHQYEVYYDGKSMECLMMKKTL